MSAGIKASADGTQTIIQVAGVDRVVIDSEGITSASLAQKLTLGTTQTTTSGTSIDFTSIPSWVKRITVMLNGVSTNGTSALMIQLGDSGGVETTGYASSTSVFTGSVLTTTIATGLLLNYSTGAASTQSGLAVLTLMNAATNTWVYISNVAFDGSAQTNSGAGKKATSTTLDRIRLTTANGTDTFDAGSVNILYEG